MRLDFQTQLAFAHDLIVNKLNDSIKHELSVFEQAMNGPDNEKQELADPVGKAN